MHQHLHADDGQALVLLRVAQMRRTVLVGVRVDKVELLRRARHAESVAVRRRKN